MERYVSPGRMLCVIYLFQLFQSCHYSQECICYYVHIFGSVYELHECVQHMSGSELLFQAANPLGFNPHRGVVSTAGVRETQLWSSTSQ